MFGGDPQYPHGGYLPALRAGAFEGLKAYRCPDGKVRVFRMDENAKRLQSTCRGILMPELPTERFEEMVKKVVRLNERFIPPYESGATLYIRPLLIGTGAKWACIRPTNTSS